MSPVLLSRGTSVLGMSKIGTDFTQLNFHVNEGHKPGIFWFAFHWRGDLEGGSIESSLAASTCFWSTCLPCSLSLQAAALFPRTTPFGGDHVQREHASLPAADAVWQIPQCPGSDQPRGPGDFSFPVSLKMTLLAKTCHTLGVLGDA